jgi:uncharacterized DUF497 family protein
MIETAVYFGATATGNADELLLACSVAVSIVHTETPERIHIISLRRATRNEEAILFKSI